jgi:hypothetical protein
MAKMKSYSNEEEDALRRWILQILEERRSLEKYNESAWR